MNFNLQVALSADQDYVQLLCTELNNCTSCTTVHSCLNRYMDISFFILGYSRNFWYDPRNESLFGEVQRQ
jgi:hypothetical protein